MMKLIIALSVFALAHAQNSAVVDLFDPSGQSGVVGNVTFSQSSNGISVQGVVRGLAPGLHGFHVHQFGNIFPTCTETGGHFNPYNENHGAPQDIVRHVGDLGNIEAGPDGVAHIFIHDRIISLQGSNNIIGRAVVVHEKADDLGKGGNPDSLVTGNAGGRLACGIIGIRPF